MHIAPCGGEREFRTWICKMCECLLQSLEGNNKYTEVFPPVVKLEWFTLNDYIFQTLAKCLRVENQ